ncbi:membrane protein of ER body 1-like isoform X2 [Cornus florida]|uniref:membrane protein of ER body 1-like isoform X2 n=1 Tax=Cornus florida TaxID=4283 RepID=UPI0028991E46|nr:membrane protein of ER body 1-like isoform X2 [Cornus florida]
MLKPKGLKSNASGADATMLEARQVKPREFHSTQHITVHPAKPIAVSERKGSKTLDILKSIVYGGLVESIASLSVVSSAAAADATTLNIVALGLANLIGGLFIIGHNVSYGTQK